MHNTIAPIPASQLSTVTGGKADWGQLATSIAGLVDQHAGTNGKATQTTQGILGIINSFRGGE